MELLLDEKQDALRLRCHETGKIHVSWVVEMGDEKSIVIFEDIPENYPATGLTIEPFTLKRVEDIFDNIYEGWGCGDVREPDSESFYGKALENCRDSHYLREIGAHLLPVCPVCKNVRLFEMTSEDVQDGRIVDGYLKCPQCGGEWPEDNVA